MTILSELAALYQRRAEREGWPRPGSSTEKIGAEVVLAADGTVIAIRSVMRPDLKGKMQPRSISVPAAVKRTSGVKPNLLWDKTSYALGVTAVDGEDGVEAGQGKRTRDEHAAFREAQIGLIGDVEDPGLSAFAAFCRTWDPAQFAAFPDALMLLDQNVVFAIEDGRRVHDLPAAQTLMLASADAAAVSCLVTGSTAAPARLHPTIKGVAGAESSGASLVSFNNDSETSHGKSQGENAPTSEAAAFAYGTALNALLARGSGRNLVIGDATVVFWSRAKDPAVEVGIEDDFAALWHEGGGRDVETSNETALRDRLDQVAQGKVPEGSALDPSAQIFVLGLAPNAARISVRFWHTDTFGALARKVTRFWDECAIVPSPFRYGNAERLPKPPAMLCDIAALRERKNIPPNLAGDLMRAVLTGLPYPATLLPAVITRLRAEGDPDRKRHGNMDGRRAALLRAVLIRNLGKEVPMALSETEDDVAYLLGRLFGAYVYAERSYQERGASLRSKYMGSASATPARVFPVLMRGYVHNLSALMKAGGVKSSSGVRVDKAIAAIMALLPGDALPATLPLEDQGRFFIGFYHQISAFYAKAEDAAQDLSETEHEGEDA